MITEYQTRQTRSTRYNISSELHNDSSARLVPNLNIHVHLWVGF